MRTGLASIVFAAVVSATASLALADYVKIDGFGYDNVIIKGVQEGKLLVLVGPKSETHAFSKVDEVRIEDVPALAEAEKAYANKEYKKAGQSYITAMNRTNNRGLQQVIMARAIPALEADGRFNDAVKYFLEVYQAHPTEAAWDLRPTKLPAKGSNMLAEAARMIESKLNIPALKAETPQKNLKMFLLEIYQKAGNDAKAAALAKELGASLPETPTAGSNDTRTTTPAAPESIQVADGATTRDVDAAIAAKDYAKAVALADSALRTAQGETAAALYMAKARALAADKKPDDAALAYLRIYAHYPSSPLAPAALLNAANIQKEQKREDAAKRLYREIVEKYPNSQQAQAARKAS